jgi:hypothetical protein
LLTIVSNWEPAKDAKKAIVQIIEIKPQFNLTFLRYWTTARLVPLKEGIFKEAITEATGKEGKIIREAGVWIKPPPPTMASTNPAQKAITQSRIK